MCSGPRLYTSIIVALGIIAHQHHKRTWRLPSLLCNLRWWQCLRQWIVISGYHLLSAYLEYFPSHWPNWTFYKVAASGCLSLVLSNICFDWFPLLWFFQDTCWTAAWMCCGFPRVSALRERRGYTCRSQDFLICWFSHHELIDWHSDLNSISNISR